MYCKACGKQIPDNSVFCNKCGAPQHAGISSVATSSESSPVSFDCIKVESTIYGDFGTKGWDTKTFKNCKAIVHNNVIEVIEEKTESIKATFRLPILSKLEKFGPMKFGGLFETKREVFPVVIRLVGMGEDRRASLRFGTVTEQEQFYDLIKRRTY